MWAKIRQVFVLCSLQGISIKPLVRFLQINLQEEKDLKLSEEINSHVSRGIYTENKLLININIVDYKRQRNLTSSCKIYKIM